MAKKQRQSDIRKPVTSRQLTRKEREKKTQRIVIIVSIVILVIAIGFAGYGYYESAFRPYNETVLEVNGTKVNMDYYLTMMKVYLHGAEATDINAIAMAVPGAIINNLLIIQRAPDLGYTISQQEIDKEIADRQMPDKKPYRDVYASAVLASRMETEYFAKKLPESVDQVQIMAMVVDSEGIAQSVLEGYKLGQPIFELIKKFGVDPISNEKTGNMGWLPKGFIDRLLPYDDITVLEDTAFSLETGEIGQPVYDPNVVKNSGYWILKVTEKDGDESARVYGILVGDNTEAEKIVERLKAGEDFSTLASQYSQDENSRQDGGDQGWLLKGHNSTIMEQAFNLDVGEISTPLHDTSIQTRGGYWIIEVLAKEENRPLDEEIRTQLIEENMMNWILEQSEDSDINNYLTDEQQKWAINKAIAEVDIGGK